jgi:hypothetical protein
MKLNYEHTYYVSTEKTLIQTEQNRESATELGIKRNGIYN